MADEIDAALAREFGGEMLLWSGRPDPSRLRGLLAVWVFAIPWTVFALVWTGLALSPWFIDNSPPVLTWSLGVAMPLFGLPFVAVGLFMLATPLAAMRKARRTIYALSDRRLLRLTLARSYEVESVPVDRIGSLRCKLGRDGWGLVEVQTGSRLDSDGDHVSERFTVAAVPDAEGLHRLLLARR